MKLKPINTVELYLKKFRLILLVIVIAVSLYGGWQWCISPINLLDKTEQVFAVPQGQSTKTIAERLKQQKLIRSTLAFRLLVEKKDLSLKLQAGEFRLSRAMTLVAIIDSLTHGSEDFWITFQEGWRSEEYAEKLAEKSTISVQDFIVAAKPFEGQLYPDTYSIPQTSSAEEVVKLLTGTFLKKSPTQDKKTIIIASLIEREAKHNEDRSLVSSVIHNRLDIGMGLQIDATVQYILGKSGKWWPNNLSYEDLRISSPYNTYLYNGLPPGPIANPGEASLRAAMEPAATNYLYYVSDNSGYNHYAKTLEEHQANVARFLTLDK